MVVSQPKNDATTRCITVTYTRMPARMHAHTHGCKFSNSTLNDAQNHIQVISKYWCAKNLRDSINSVKSSLILPFPGLNDYIHTTYHSFSLFSPLPGMNHTAGHNKTGCWTTARDSNKWWQNSFDTLRQLLWLNQQWTGKDAFWVKLTFLYHDGCTKQARTWLDVLHVHTGSLKTPLHSRHILSRLDFGLLW
jgi:hypothetical protein